MGFPRTMAATRPFVGFQSTSRASLNLPSFIFG